MQDLSEQNDFIKNKLFRVTRVDTFDELKVKIYDIIEDSRKYDVNVRIMDGAHYLPDSGEHNTLFSGLIFSNFNNYLSMNRQLNQKEIEELFNYIVEKTPHVKIQ